MAEFKRDPGGGGYGGPGGGGVNTGSAPPPPKPGGKANQYEKFVKWAMRQGAARPIANDMWYWAHKYGVNVYYWASVIKLESGFSNKADSGQATGIGQIAYSWVGSPVPWAKNKTITLADIKSYGFNIRFSAYLLGNAVSKYGYDGAYTKGYNPNDPNRFKAWNTIKATYKTSQQPWPSPSAGPGVAPPNVGGTSADVGDPFVSGVNKKGKITTSDDARKAIKFDGMPVTLSGFLGLKRSLESIYVAWTGKRPSNNQVQQYIGKGWSTYSLQLALSKSPNFKNSPYYKSTFAEYSSLAGTLGLLAPGEKVPTELIRQAALFNWNEGTMASKLRDRPGYLKSNEFSKKTADLDTVYQSIFGTSDDAAKKAIQEAALGGWDVDQFASWLRSTDSYKFSPEYQSKTLSFLDALGLITGSTSVLRDTGKKPILSHKGLPDDKRVRGTGDVTGQINLTPGLSG